MTAGRIVILTGAGISAESGIKTFRDANGLWENHALEDVATPDAFARDPALVHRFYNARRAQLLQPEIRPNAAHLALAELERRWPGEVFLVTQNVDNLHERAGSRRLLHMHGELLKARCALSDEVFEWREALESSTACPCCGEAGRLRPHIVWFGEMPIGMDLIHEALDECDLFLSIGTSGHVYPAAGFVAHVGRRARTVEINLEPSQVTSFFAETIHGPATREVTRFVDGLLASI